MKTINRDYFDLVFDRLRGLLALKSDAELSDALGMKPTAFANRKKNRSIPFEEIVAVANDRGISIDSILGVGNSHKVVNEPHGAYAVTKDDSFVMVPRYDVKASAGGGVLIHSELIVDYLAFRHEWVSKMGLSRTQLALIEVHGDSMEPALNNQDLILVDLRTSELSVNDIYVIQHRGHLLVKRIQILLDGSVKVISDNPKYETEQMTAEEAQALTVLGRVVWFGRGM